MEEKWVVAFFRNSYNKRIHYRQFLAAGFYEAYDTVMNFSEKTSAEILWFKEKRNCGSIFDMKVILSLECVCTFCNKFFNDIEPLRCNFKKNDECKSEFCSLKCRQEHIYYKHVLKK